MTLPKNWTPFATDDKGEKWVDVAILATRLVNLLHDGMSLCQWPDDRSRYYTKLSDALPWLAREIADCVSPERKRDLELAVKACEMFRDQKEEETT